MQALAGSSEYLTGTGFLPDLVGSWEETGVGREGFEGRKVSEGSANIKGLEDD